MINVNLLPEEIKSEINQSKKNRIVLAILYKTLGIIFFTAIIFAFFYSYFNIELNNAKESYGFKEKSLKEYGSLQESAQKIAEKINTIKKIEASSNDWSGTIDEINNIVPAGIYLNSIKLDSSAKTRGQITGRATSKNEVATFRDNLEKSQKFQYVDIESSTTQIDPLSKKEAENFTITLSLEKGALKWRTKKNIIILFQAC